MTTNEAIEAVRIERERQKEKWLASHDKQHESFEWVGLIATYASQGRYVEAAALAVAALEAGSR